MLGERIKYTVNSIPAATANIYEQQYQMGLFVKQYYTGRNVVLNDIGAVNYLAEIRCLDIWGLGTTIEEEWNIRNNKGRTRLGNLIQNSAPSIAVVYDEAVTEFAPKWKKVAEWKIKEKIVCAYTKVSFYALANGEEDDLLKHIQDFSTLLPLSVEQNIIFQKESN